MGRRGREHTLLCRLPGLDFSFLFFQVGIACIVEGDNLSEGTSSLGLTPPYPSAFVGTPGHQGRSQIGMSSSIHGLGTMTLPLDPVLLWSLGTGSLGTGPQQSL